MAADAERAAKIHTYKQLKEDFVSNHSGGEVSEINYVTIVAPVALILWSVLQSRQGFFKDNGLLGLIVDFLLNVGAILLAITLYAGAPLLLSILLVAPAVLLYGFPVPGRRKKPQVPPSATNETQKASLNPLPMKPFMTSYRGSMLVITCLAILAVDFRIFPRRFAKVETWGTSLMDMGVGSFVFAGGVVAARPLLREKAEGRTTPLLRRLGQSLRHSIPLLVLGLVRLLSVKGLDYAEHVTEYGVHWNFFFTLGFLPPFVAASQSALKIVPSYAVLAVFIGVLYQVVLESTKLKVYIITAPRTDLLSMNREGIFSFIGYLAIFLAGQDAGMFVLPRSSTSKASRSGSSQTKLLVRLGAWFAIWTGLYFFVTDYKYGAGVNVSRRMANLPYVLWVASFNLGQMFLFCLVEAIFFPSTYSATDAKSEREAYQVATSKVLHAYNRNGLAIFLVANLLTGLVNMTVPTLNVGVPASMCILLGYAAVTTALALALDMYNISIKL